MLVAHANVGIGIRYRMDGSNFMLRRLEAKPKVKTDTVNDFLFADDCALSSISKVDMEKMLISSQRPAPNLA